jgi:eukaryotic-like serine/threonine-protein kinase
MGDEPSSVMPASPEQAVFAEVLQRDTPEARAAYLDAACGTDTELRQRVEALLRAAENAGDFLEQPPAGLSEEARATLLETEFTEKPGDRIGRYKLLEKIGEGGCGAVYMAEQEEPVRRRVALKIIKLGMDTRSVVARFEAERQALALMDHPNIAKVLDGGATQTGRPYFVMELVRGVRITEFCDETRLSTEGRLRLFVQVCQAIQHAHQKGIIHRDLKPSNILVTVNDGAPVPKVIDFGIAKATGQRLTDKTLFTQFHAFIGTPAYTSPEQAEMSSVDIDTRSDIYSLGVLLYELLTGKTPFDGEELLRSGLDEMRRVIRDDAPPRPSTRLTQELHRSAVGSTGHWPVPSGDSPDGAAKPPPFTTGEPVDTRRSKMPVGGSPVPPITPARLLQLKNLIHLVQGDLDCIVMKCLEKDRARRYATANGLAADIQRHLDHEPIQARPVNALGRLWRWRRRHPAVAALSASVLLLLIVVAVGSTVSAWRVASARHAEHEERTKAEAANRDLRSANTHLADTVSLLELRRAEDEFRVNDPSAGVAHLAAMLRRDPSNHIAASRLVSALVHRNWALPSIPPMRHEGRVVSASFSPDGRHVLSASWDKTAKIWDAATGNAVATLQHEDKLFGARYSSDGARIVTASADGIARIWNSTNGVAMISLDHRPRQVWWAEFSPDGQSVVTACPADYTARVWNVASGALTRELGGHGSEVLMALFTPDNKQVVTGTQAGLVAVCDLDLARTVFRIEPQHGRVNALAISPDGKRLAVAYHDGLAQLYNLRSHQNLGPPLVHGEWIAHRNDARATHVFHAAFSPDSRWLLTGQEGGYARLWDVTTGQRSKDFRHDAAVNFGAFSPDGKMVVTASMDHSARLWEVRTGIVLSQPLRETEAMLHAGFSPDGRRLVTASVNGTVQLWNIQPRHFHAIGMRHEKRVTTLAFDPRGESVLSASFDQTARLWNARTGKAFGQPMRHQGVVQSADYSADGRRIVTASEDGTAHVWDSGTGETIAGPLRHAKTVWSAQFSPDGQRVATASADGTARIWDPRTGESMTPPLEHGASVNVARFSLDGRLVVTGSENRSARVWNAQTGQPVTEWLRHMDHVEWAEFSPDSRLVVSASGDNTARIWEVGTGKPIGAPLQHARTVPKAVFSPDGRRVITASLDLTARVWDASTGEALTEPLKHSGPVSQVCVSPDGRHILTAALNGTARAWDLHTGLPLTEWLNADDVITSACFDSTGRRFAIGSDKGMVRVWDVPPVPTPGPAWFLALAEAVAGMRLNARGNTELVARRELEQLRQQLALGSSNDFYERLARWFLADRSQRPVSPF